MVCGSLAASSTLNPAGTWMDFKASSGLSGGNSGVSVVAGVVYRAV
jgi:hypothetical protein